VLFLPDNQMNQIDVLNDPNALTRSHIDAFNGFNQMNQKLFSHFAHALHFQFRSNVPLAVILMNEINQTTRIFDNSKKLWDRYQIAVMQERPFLAHFLPLSGRSRTRMGGSLSCFSLSRLVPYCQIYAVMPRHVYASTPIRINV
jgi:hypothetical protein